MRGRRLAADVASKAWLLFVAAWQDAGLDAREDAAVAAFSELQRRYGSLDRHYHDLEHILFGNESLRQIPGLTNGIEHLIPMVSLAYFFHDAIYDPGAPRGKNERLSADLACKRIKAAGGDIFFVNGVESLIIDTVHDTYPPTQAGRVMVDIDLIELAVPWKEFEVASQAVREEYRAVVPDDRIFWSKRAEVLCGFLERPQIYCTQVCHDQYETRARENLRRAIDEARA